MKASDRDYRKSKAEISLRFKPGSDAGKLAHMFLEIPCNDHEQRSAVARQLCDELSRNAGISPLNSVEFLNKPEPHSHDGKRLRRKVQGMYRATEKSGLGRGITADVRIFNLTAMRQQPRAALGALTTLLHEWAHHYDTEKLRIATIHTSGFYARLKEIRRELGV